MERHELETTDPLDHEIALWIKNAIAAFEPPSNHREWVLSIAGFIKISPFLYSVSTLTAPRYLRKSTFLAYPRNPWDEALSCYSCYPLFSSGMTLGAS